MTQTNQQIWYPWQRALRTFVTSIVVLLPTLNLLAANTVDYLNEHAELNIPSGVFLWLNGFVLITGAIMGLVSRWMATPGFNALLTKIGLGSAPKSAGIDPAVPIDPDPNLKAGVPPDTSDEATLGGD